jgi:transcription initiation factor IIF auxiliary subunit
MAFRFTNYSRQTGQRGDYTWYEWMVFMDEPPDRLELVEAVEYRLHETFPKPVRFIDDPTAGFVVRSAGWGEFRIMITVYLKDGTEVQSTYMLDLTKPWPVSDSTPVSPPG